MIFDIEKKAKSNKDNITLQQDQSDCGPAALSTVVKIYGGQIDLETIRSLSGTDSSGTTLLGLYEAAADCGFDPEGVEMDFDTLTTLGEICILHTKNKDQEDHYIVYLGCDSRRKRIFIADPASGFNSVDYESLDGVWVSKIALLLTPNEKFTSKKGKNREKLKWFIAELRKDEVILYLSLFLGIIASILGLSMAIFMQKLIDNWLPAQKWANIFLGIITLSVILISKVAITYIRQLFVLFQSQNLNNRLTTHFFKKLLFLPKSFFDSRNTGDLVSRINDTQRIQRSIVTIGGSLAIDFIVVITSLVFLIFYYWKIGLIVLSFIPIILYVYWKFNTPVKEVQDLVMKSYAATESSYIDTIQGIDTISEYSAQSLFQKITMDKFDNYQKNILKLGKVANQFVSSSELLATIFNLALIGVICFLVLNNQVSVGELVSILSIVGIFFPSLSRLSQINVITQEAKIAFDRIYDLVNLEIKTDEVVDEFNIDDINTLQLVDISFRFRGRPVLFEVVNFRLVKNEILCLRGASGKGKSTLLQLILKNYTPESGEILINGHNISKITQSSLRNHISIVNQDIKIFNGTVLHNILLNSSISLEDFFEFVRNNRFEIFFDSLPNGFLTQIGEQGVKLSGGQRQMIGICRALIKNPSLILLDEATSAMDRDLEKLIVESILKIKDRTMTVWISHREEILGIADKVVNL